MSHPFNKVALLGHGRIGQAIKLMLQQHGYIVGAYDIKPQLGAQLLDPNDQSPEYFKTILTPYDSVITATPYHLNLAIAQAAIETGTSYFDLTEDVAIAKQIHEMAVAEAQKPDHDWLWVSPQCGLAPGAVNMIARGMAEQFDSISDINVRVGALPRTANNNMKYYLTWSSEGLINEYCNPCEALVNGEKVLVQPLEGYEKIVIDGVEYEAFNTSGGIGTLIDTMLASNIPVENITYKTMRYQGHRDLMYFLFHDLGLASQKELVVDIFNKAVPQVTQDVIVIFIQVTGLQRGVLKNEIYCRTIRGDGNFTAIQRTTASGVCAVLHYCTAHREELEGQKNVLHFVSPEHVPMHEMVGNPFWKPYEI